ncbi:MAG: hypothetical protein JWP91_687 [Fibrobacteres bacterium]|nr:hypothetical protein [Fibrobacterota bacterium]
MADDSQNESNLVQRREDRRTLEKMRRKLASSGKISSKHNLPQLKSGKRAGMRIWPLAIAAGVLLIGLNFGLSLRQDKITSAVDASSSANLSPPPGLTLDEQVRFWAYAVYDVPKLRSKFHIPKGAVLNPVVARKNLEQLLAENLGIEVRNEIFAYQQKFPDAVPKAKAKARTAATR